ncbi:hypothetical protein F5Y07DRAFT_170671 [Xylaria sp. FL0933]|nr:hypothetical protein F5Y07DRAFT_170671 [Xylaria sp. FL0933]
MRFSNLIFLASLGRWSVAISLRAQPALLPGFDSPSSEYRPKFRYWFPDASVPHESVTRDIDEVAAVGGGGIEFVPFYNYGLGPAVTDWSIYGFGTEAFKSLLLAALNTTANNGLVFDFALGPNQGAGVPSKVATPGLAMELVYGNVTVAGGDTFSGPVPAANVNFNTLTDLGFMNDPELWGQDELIAVVAGQVLREQLLSEPFYVSVLNESSLLDLTNLTTGDGELIWTAPGSNNATWVLFGIYERFTNQRSCVSVLNATTALGNGSWIVDHWSAAGAKKTTDCWDDQILSDPQIATLLSKVGEYAWEDSMEMQAALPWTPSLLETFETLHGYNPIKYLPVFFHVTNAWNGLLPPYNVTYTFDGYPADGGKYVQDYKTALSLGYAEYLQHYSEWASSKGLKLSTQPAYNMPVEMTAAIAKVPVPELESLGFSESIALYRQFTGTAHASNRNVISTEVGAVLGGAYKLRVPELQGLFAGSFVAGVNMMVVHGYAYGGEYEGTTWPGYTPFQYEYTEAWNYRHPAWMHFNDTMLYAARNSLVLQTGTPKVDVAFCYFENPYEGTAGAGSAYSPEDFNALGYTFEYIGLDTIVSEQTVVTNGTLLPAGPAFKALVFYNETQITPDASKMLVDFAEDGLPIYLVGSVPNTTIGARGQELVSANVAELLTYPSVHVLTTGEFSASVLAEDGITPRISIQDQSDAKDLYTFWRSDLASGNEYVYLYNSGTSRTFNMSFTVPAGSKPYSLDAWTGLQQPIAVYEEIDGATRLAVTLNANQTTIVGFSTASTIPATHVVSHSSNIERIQETREGGLEAWVTDASDAWAVLSSGEQITLPSPGDEATLSNLTLGPWNLTVQSYGPSADYATLDGNITTIDVGTINTLAPWTEITGLEQVSGVGTYVSRFDLSDTDQKAVLISFGPVLNTLRAWVNGHMVPPIDPTNPVNDVSDLVVEGINEIKIEVTSTLFNAVKANIDHVKSVGRGAQTPSYYTDADWAEFGLIGPVKLRMARKVVLT